MQNRLDAFVAYIVFQSLRFVEKYLKEAHSLPLQNGCQNHWQIGAILIISI